MSNQRSSIKRIRENHAKFIPLLKQNTDINEQVSNFVKEGNCEQCCIELKSCISEINEVILYLSCLLQCTNCSLLFIGN